MIRRLEGSADLDRVISLSVAYDLEKPDSALEATLASSKVPISLSTVYKDSSPEAIAGLKWALSRGRPVDIDIQATLTEATLESFEDLVGKAAEGLESSPPIILCNVIILPVARAYTHHLVANVLPPPHDLDLPIIKLMNHPTFLAFSNQVAALSLLPNVYIKFLPPAWDQPTPQTPYPGSPIDTQEGQVQREWKRRIKLYREWNCRVQCHPLSAFNCNHSSWPCVGSIRIPENHLWILPFSRV